MSVINIIIWCLAMTLNVSSYNILAIFPYNGRSHHILFSALVEELALIKHNVTVVNYFPVKSMANLRQISLDAENVDHDIVNMEEHMNSASSSYFANFYNAYDTAKAFKYIANNNCEKLIRNKEVKELVATRKKFDVIIVEQFVTDCGLAIAYKLNAPVVGMTAHVLMPWTYSRLGAPNNPTFVPSHFFGSGSRPNMWNRIQSAIINTGFNLYYTYVIQSYDQEIINKEYPDIPDVEDIGRNMSLIMLNQYFPLTGSRLYGANVIEIGGLHINEETKITDMALQTFLDNADNRVVYISFGTVAANFPPTTTSEILKFIKETPMKFIWKTNAVLVQPLPKNLFVSNWLPQSAILSHPKVAAFITHSGMLSSSEAIHYGVPILSVPLFGDQFANAASAVECGLGITINIHSLTKNVLIDSLNTVLKKSYQVRAKQLSKLWNDRPLSPRSAAVYWIEYVSRHKGLVAIKPPTVNIGIIEYFMLDVLLIFAITAIFIMYIFGKFVFGKPLSISKSKKNK